MATLIYFLGEGEFFTESWKPGYQLTLERVRNHKFYAYKHWTRRMRKLNTKVM